MSVTEFRRQKLYFVFDRFFDDVRTLDCTPGDDVNHSGTIEKKDFELAVEQICRIRGWSSGDVKYEETRDRFFEIWEALRLRADANKDEQVSREEWCQLWLGENNDEDWQKAYMNFMFQLQDTSGDGCIDVEEFTSVCSSFGVDSEESRKAFETLSKNGKAIVDLDYYSGLWKDYFSSDDPSTLGNFIFGKTSFP